MLLVSCLSPVKGLMIFRSEVEGTPLVWVKTTLEVRPEEKEGGGVDTTVDLKPLPENS